MGSICCCGQETCPFTDSNMPVIRISGMTAIDGGTFTENTCCFIQCFEYDVLQPLLRYDAGETMSYDGSSTCVTETFYYPFTCGQVTQTFWEIGDPTPDPIAPSKRVLGEADHEIWIAEPANTGCCPSAVQANGVTAVDRKRGGTHFLVSYRPFRICVTIQKVIRTCAPDPAVEAFFVTWKSIYQGYYIYWSYYENTVDYTYVNSDAACWNVAADTSSTLHYPYSFADWDGLSGTALEFTVCRQKVLDGMPTSTTDLTFEDGDIITPDCVDQNDRSLCSECVTETHCFTSDATGVSEPYPGFCAANVASTAGFTADIKACGFHTTYIWTNHQQADVTPLPTYAEDVFCYQHWALSGDPAQDVYVQIWADGPFPAFTLHYNWDDIAACTQTVTWNTIVNLGTDCVTALPTSPIGATSCYPRYTCNSCPSAGHQNDPADVNLVTAPTTYVTLETLYDRVVSHARTVTCSGYTERSHCYTFVGGTISLISTPFMKDFGMENADGMGEFV